MTKLQSAIDLTQKITDGDAVWPGDPPTVIKALDSGSILPNPIYLNQISLGEHSGTHLGAPSHYGFLSTMNSFKTQLMSGRALIIRCENHVNKPIGAAAINTCLVAEGIPTEAIFELIIISTGWASHWGSKYYFTGEPTTNRLPPGLDLSALELLFTSFNPKIIGIDSPNIDFGGATLSDTACGREIARQGAFHLENIGLVPPDTPCAVDYLLMPLRIESGGGAPARLVICYG